MNNNRATLLDMAQAARDILEFAQGMDYSALLADRKTQSALIHQFLILGEAAKQLSDAFKAGHPEMPWDDMARMRDKLVHHYREVKIRILWDAIQNDIPKPLAFLEPFLTREDA